VRYLRDPPSLTNINKPAYFKLDVPSGTLFAGFKTYLSSTIIITFAWKGDATDAIDCASRCSAFVLKKGGKGICNRFIFNIDLKKCSLHILR
jgi:hypothetical protein